MKCSVHIDRLLMVFLLLWFGVHAGGVFAQNGYMSIEEIEAETGEKVYRPHWIKKMNGFTDAFNFTPLKTLPDLQRMSLTDPGNELAAVRVKENYLYLLMDGKHNNMQATQNGRDNIMDIGVYGNSNEGIYHQQGNLNYIFDRIGSPGNPVSGQQHEIYQQGKELGVMKRGIQTIPMIINQRGRGMKIQIQGSPVR